MNSTLVFTATDKTQVASYSAERAYQLVGSVASSAPSGAETELLSIHGLVKRYGEAIAVNELSLTLERGEVFGFLGPNGAGKNLHNSHAVRSHATQRRLRKGPRIRYLAGSFSGPIALRLCTAAI